MQTAHAGEPTSEVLGRVISFFKYTYSVTRGPLIRPLSSRCSLPEGEFLNGVRALQQPRLLPPNGVVRRAIIIDWLPTSRYEYRLREAGWWRLHRTEQEQVRHAGAF